MPQPPALQLSSTLERVYDAATRPQAWQDAIDGIVSFLGARTGALLVRDTGAFPYNLHGLNTVYARMAENGTLQRYLEEFAHHEEPMWAHIENSAIGLPERDEEMGVGASRLDRRPDYAFLRQHAGALRRIGYRLNDNRGWFDFLSIGYHPSVARVSDAALAQSAIFHPHLARAVELGRSFSLLQSRYQAALAVLDKINLGLFLALENGTVIVANAQAQRLVSQGDGLGLSPAGRLALNSAEQSARLQAAIAGAARTARGQGHRAQHVLRVTRPSGAPPLLVETVPISDANGELEPGLRGALVIVVDPENPLDFDIALFARLHALTRAEAEVCGLLIQGLKTAEIADHRNTRFATAKNQIASVYHKTAARNRGELVRCLVRTLPPIL